MNGDEKNIQYINIPGIISLGYSMNKQDPYSVNIDQLVQIMIKNNILDKAAAAAYNNSKKVNKGAGLPGILNYIQIKCNTQTQTVDKTPKISNKPISLETVKSIFQSITN